MLLDKRKQEPPPTGIKRADSSPALGLFAWAKDWAVVGLASITVFVLVSVAVAAMVFAMSERQQLNELRGRTEDRLTSIDRELAALGAGVGQLLSSLEASKPDFPRHFLELLNQNMDRALRNDDPILAMETATAVTKKARELRIDSDPQNIAAFGRGFLRLLEDEPLPVTPTDGPDTQANVRLYGPAIETVGELIGYRSYLLPNPLGQPDGPLAHSAMLKLPKLHSFRPLDSASKIIGTSRSLPGESGSKTARIDLLNLPEPTLSEDYRALVVDGYDLKIDGLDARNVLFINCKITYSGAPVALDNVYFSNCTFDIARQGRDFAGAALSPSGQVGFIKR
jgi:hypothetical protein